MSSHSSSFDTMATAVPPPGQPGRDTDRERRLRRLGLIGAALFSLFIIYGSLFPFSFSDAGGLDPLTELGIILRGDGMQASRIDFATNVMLSIPVAFCLMAGMRLRWHPRDTGLALLVLLWCVVLGAAVETAQAYVPGRVPSRYDIMAQGIGAVVGLALWAWRGAWLWSLVFDWSPFNERQGGWKQAAHLYLVGMFAYGLLPLDLTISPFDIWQKWKEGLIHVLPLHQLAHPDGRVAYQLASLLLLWGIAAWLLRRAYGLSRASTVARTAACAAVLEVLQLFVFSRSTDSTDVLMAALAASVVAVLTGGGQAVPAQPVGSVRKRSAAWILLAVAAVTALTLALSWYPYEWQPDPGAWHLALRGWVEVPLGAFFATGPLQAGTTFLQKALLFAPWGALALWSNRGRSLGVQGAAVLLYAFGLMLVVEAGKLFLLDKVSNPVNIGFEMFGVWLAYLWARAVRPAPAARSTVHRPAPIAVPATPQPAAVPAGRGRSWRVLVPVQMLLTGVALAALGLVDALPYNLRAVLNDRNILQWLCLTCAIWLTVLPWAWLGGVATRERYRLLWIWLLAPLLLFVLLRLGAPYKQVYDIVGTSSLGLPWETEAALRFAVLNLLVAWGIYSVHRWLDRQSAGPLQLGHGALWLLLTLCAMALWHVVVVQNAVTDNLVELMQDTGTWWTTPLIFLWWALFYAGALLLGQVLVGRRSARALLALPILAVAAYLVVDQALEPMLVKYGKAFSAWQFLLSSDRTSYADPLSLVLRYAAAHAAITLGLVWCLLPLLQARRTPPPPRVPVPRVRRHRRD